MNNYENEFNINDEKATDSFNFADISGLGESDYDNPDLFDTSVSDEVVHDSLVDKEEPKKEEPFYVEQPITSLVDDEDDIDMTPFAYTNDFKFDPQTGKRIYDESDNEISSDKEKDGSTIDSDMKEPELVSVNPDELKEEDNIVEPEVKEPELVSVNPDELKEDDIVEPEVKDSDFVSVESDELKEEDDTDLQKPVDELNNDITFSDTSVDELSKLTEYEEPKIDTTDINGLFDKVNVNVKEASDIFRKNTEMKDKIDLRFNELKKLQSEIEKSKQENIAEVDRYKEEVVQKLTSKKQEIEDRLNVLKNLQADLEKEKKEFEKYKEEEKEKIEATKKNIESAYDERKQELSHIEDILRKQKDSLDEQRSQLSLDKIQYEADKNELANNLLKFNELVNSFTNGVNEVEND